MQLSSVALVTAMLGRAGALSFTGPRCGELQCDRTEYCNNFSDRCEPCQNICNITNHNYDQSLCVANCQNYIHDSLYVKVKTGQGDVSGVVSDLQGRVHTLTLICIFLFVIVTALLTFFSFGYLRKGYRWINQKMKKKKIDVGAFTHENPHTESPISHRRKTPEVPIVISPNAAAQATDEHLDSSTPSSNSTMPHNSTLMTECTSQRQPLDVQNLNRFASSQYIPDTPETQSTRVDHMIYTNSGTRLPSEDSVLELQGSNNNGVSVRFNATNNPVIYNQ